MGGVKCSHTFPVGSMSAELVGYGPVVPARNPGGGGNMISELNIHSFWM